MKQYNEQELRNNQFRPDQNKNRDPVSIGRFLTVRIVRIAQAVYYGVNNQSSSLSSFQGTMTVRSSQMQSNIETNDREFLEELHRMGASTIQQICDATEVTATAVRQRLIRLEGRGLVDRKAVREGRGRPHHVYQVTIAALRSLGDNYSDLALILWRELMQIEEEEVRQRVMERIKQSLIQQYSKNMNGRSALDRFMELRTSLNDRGFNVEVDGNVDLPVLRENSCPYHELASQDSSICEMEQSVFEEVLGMKIERTQCCMDGHHSCEFVPVSEAS